MIHKAIDVFLVYQFLRRLALPFNKWQAFRVGVIDDKGEIVVKEADRTPEQKQAFGKFDLMILKIKKLLARVPGGSSKIASYMAALWLIKEWNHFTDRPMITESVSESDINESLNLFLEWYLYYIPDLQEGNREIAEDGESGAPTVNVGGGDIAGLGVGSQGEPGLTKAQQKKHRKRAVADVVGRKTFATFIGEASPIPATYPTEPTNIKRYRRIKRHPVPTVRDA